MSMFRSLHHVAIIASDYKKSRGFYVDILGLDVIREVWREARQSWKCDLAIGPVHIELFSFPRPPSRLSHPEATGLRHLAFTVKNIDDAVGYLHEHRVTCEPIRNDATTGKRFTFFTDPDGLPLELYQL